LSCRITVSSQFFFICQKQRQIGLRTAVASLGGLTNSAKFANNLTGGANYKEKDSLSVLEPVGLRTITEQRSRTMRKAHRGLLVMAILAGGTALLALVWQPAPGPVGHWKLDETAGTAAADTSGTSPGVYTGTPTHDTVQKPTLAAVFLPNTASLNCDTVDDYVDIANTASLENITEGSYTISLWVRPAQAPNDEIKALFIKPGGSGNEGIWWRQPTAGSLTSGFIVMEHRLQTVPISATFAQITANGSVPANDPQRAELC
jgi:hypothetical protein